MQNDNAFYSLKVIFFYHFDLQIGEVVAMFKIASMDRGVLNGFESNGIDSSGMVRSQGLRVAEPGLLPWLFYASIRIENVISNFGLDNMQR